MRADPFFLKANATWRLEGPLAEGQPALFYSIDQFPMTVGRRTGADLVLSEPSVSGRHARFERRNGHLYIVDLDSTNGTWVNGEAVRSMHRLSEKDIVQFGSVEFRVRDGVDGNSLDLTETQETCMVDLHATPGGATAALRLRELMDRGQIRSVFQSIVRVDGLDPIGYEALTRGMHPDLPESPAQLLHLAERGGTAAALSRFFRDRAVRTLDEAALGPCRLFFNAHPRELDEEDLIENLEALASGLRSEYKLVLEVHEGALLDLDKVGVLQRTLRDAGIEMAFDDFGTGRTRLNELGESPPDFIKFARPLVSDLEHAPWERRHVLKTMVAMARDLGCTPLAEGVETRAELEICADLGFVLAQGYFFDTPTSVDQLVARREVPPTDVPYPRRVDPRRSEGPATLEHSVRPGPTSPE